MKRIYALENARSDLTVFRSLKEKNNKKFPIFATSNLMNYVNDNPPYIYNDEESLIMKKNNNVNCTILRYFLSICYGVSLSVKNGIRNIVCIGAPASELVVLIKLFPSVNFYLFKDPFNNEKFDGRIYKPNASRPGISNVFVYNRDINDNDINKFHKYEKLTVICNIRHGSVARPGQLSMCKIIDYQKNIVQKINPMYSITKFCVPYNSGSTAYMDGVMFCPIYAKGNSTETFIITMPNFKIIDYDHDRYNNFMFSHNKLRMNEYIDLNAFCTVIEDLISKFNINYIRICNFIERYIL